MNVSISKYQILKIHSKSHHINSTAGNTLASLCLNVLIRVTKVKSVINNYHKHPIEVA